LKHEKAHCEKQYNSRRRAVNLLKLPNRESFTLRG
jgi:hypothetical protein